MPQYSTYTVYLRNTSNSDTLTYADSQYGVPGTIELTNEAFPWCRFQDSVNVYPTVSKP